MTGRAGRARADVRAGLSKRQKELPPKYFYDARGSRLFDRITRLPEYYLTRAERALLERVATPWIEALRPRTLVELGPGGPRKARILLDAMGAAGCAAAYVPIDISVTYLDAITATLARTYPGLDVEPVAADVSRELPVPAGLPDPALFALLGSTIGNFEREDATALLGRVRERMRAGDRFLMGVDLVKDAARLEAAYNDAEGVTAEFNLNMLRVLNRLLGADFDLSAFEHRAFYSAAAARIEMHLVSTRPQTVTVPEVGRFEFAAGESIRTEVSCKYDRRRVEALFSAAGLGIERWDSDAEGLFALVLGAPAARAAA